MQMLVASDADPRAVGIERINVATYQSVSGAGAKGVRRTRAQTADLLNSKPIEPKAFPRQIAFNVIPHIDEFLENGYTKEEMKMVWETRKILGAPDHPGEPDVRARAGVLRAFRGGAYRDADKITPPRRRALLSRAPGVHVLDERKTGGYPTPVSTAPARMRYSSVGSAKTSRIRAVSIFGSFPTICAKVRR